MRLVPQSFFSQQQVRADQLRVLSGSLTGNPDGSITVNTARLRTVLDQPLPNIRSINVRFRILGNSPTVKPDSDGVTRKGVTLWANVLNACNLDFLSCRTDSREVSGTIVVEAQSQINPLVTGPIDNAQLNSCAGLGYTPPLKTVSNIDIMDGSWHSFRIDRIGKGYGLYLDGQFMVATVPPRDPILFDTGLYGLRTDNVNIQLVVTVE